MPGPTMIEPRELDVRRGAGMPGIDGRGDLRMIGVARHLVELTAPARATTRWTMRR